MFRDSASVPLSHILVAIVIMLRVGRITLFASIHWFFRWRSVLQQQGLVSISLNQKIQFRQKQLIGILLKKGEGTRRKGEIGKLRRNHASAWWHYAYDVLVLFSVYPASTDIERDTILTTGIRGMYVEMVGNMRPVSSERQVAAVTPRAMHHSRPSESLH